MALAFGKRIPRRKMPNSDPVSVLVKETPS